MQHANKNSNSTNVVDFILFFFHQTPNLKQLCLSDQTDIGGQWQRPLNDALISLSASVVPKWQLVHIISN